MALPLKEGGITEQTALVAVEAMIQDAERIYERAAMNADKAQAVANTALRERTEAEDLLGALRRAVNQMTGTPEERPLTNTTKFISGAPRS